MGLGVAGWRLLHVLPALAALGAGCEILVDGELGPVLCTAEGAVGPPACPEGALCRDGACVDMQLPERALGAPCVEHTDCGTLDFCLDPTLFDGEGPSVCARACCSSSDCEPVRDAVCWIPDRGGGGLCRIGRDVGRPEVGEGLSGDRCDAPRDCRSGICSEGTCVDACCSDTNCAADRPACQLTTALVSSGPAWACQPESPGSLGYFEACVEDADCSSGLCTEIDGIDRCTISCCGTETCPAPPGDLTSNVACTEVTTGGRATVRACAKLLRESSFAAVGVPCATDTSCRSGMCVKVPGQEQEFCSDVCCGDASCGDASRFGCRPYSAGPSWALRCEPK